MRHVFGIFRSRLGIKKNMYRNFEIKVFFLLKYAHMKIQQFFKPNHSGRWGQKLKGNFPAFFLLKTFTVVVGHWNNLSGVLWTKNTLKILEMHCIFGILFWNNKIHIYRDKLWCGPWRILSELWIFLRKLRLRASAL